MNKNKENTYAQYAKYQPWMKYVCLIGCIFKGRKVSIPSSGILPHVTGLTLILILPLYHLKYNHFSGVTEKYLKSPGKTAFQGQKQYLLKSIE